MVVGVGPLPIQSALAVPDKPAGPIKTAVAPIQQLQRDSALFSPTDKAFVSKFLAPGTYMPISDIKAGMKGYGLTVFHGNKIERFNVEVISVVKKVLNGRDAILARLSGGEMGKNCVIKGMSGSPCYINGKLIGAVSFGFDFSKEPIAGITPIVDMLDALADTSGGKGAIAHLSAPSWAISHNPQGENGMSMVSGGGAPRMVPLMAPVSLTGFSQRAEAVLSKKFQDIGLGVTSGASGALDPQLAMMTEKDIKPGSAVAVLLSTGDFNIAATGTATARFGDKVIGFGHPFMQGGNIDFPMATAFVHQVMPSLSVSFKLASPVSLVGSVTADRPWGIGGKMGRASHMIPATLTVIDEPRKISRTYSCQVIDHPELTPDILAATVTSAIDATHQTAGPYVAKVESHFEADGIEPIDRVDRFATGIAPKSFMDMFTGGGDPVGRFVNRTTGLLSNNDFQKASMKSINLKITIQDGHKTAKIDRVYIDKPYAAPGEEVTVTAVLKPFNKEPVEESITFHVPRDIPDGNMVIGIAGGQDYNYVKNRLGIVDPEPETLKQIAQQIREEGRGDQISLVVALPEQSLMVNGTKLINPPAYWTKVFFSNRHTKGPTLVKGEMKTTRDEEWMLFNSHIIALEVRSPDKANARTAPYPISAPFNNSDDLSMTEQARKALESFPSVGRKSSFGSRGGSSSSSTSSSGTATTLQGASSGSSTASSSSSTSSTSTTKAASTSMITASIGKEYPHIRPLQIWRQDSDEEFRAGKMEDSTVDSWGRISPGFDSVATRQVSSVDQIWSGVWSNGYFYYGSADELWRWKGDNSKPEKIGKLDGMFIPAMTADSKGNVYAATVPSGHIWQLEPTQGAKPRIFFTTKDEPIIACLTVDDKDNVLVGTAGSGKVYKVDPSRKSTTIFDSEQAHVLSLFFHKPDGTLYVGTGERGSVYAIDTAGKAKAIYQSPDQFVTGIARDKKGDLYVASAGQGHLVRISPDGESTTLASSEAFYRLHYDQATDSVMSGDAEGDITMACIDPMTKQPYFMPVTHTEQEAVLALASDGKKLFAATSNLAVLRSFEMKLSSKPRYISAIKDGQRTSHWSRLHAYGPFNETNADLSTKLHIETRTGETSKPDETWSPWQLAAIKNESFDIASPAGRYFQYRLSWDTSKDQIGVDKIDHLTLGRIDTTYLPGNTAPTISTISMKSGAAVAGKQDLAVTGSDGDGDNLLLAIEISPDGGTTWKALKDDIRSKNAKSGASSKSSDDDDDKKEDSKTEKKEDTKAEKKSDNEVSKAKSTSTDSTDDADDDKDESSSKEGSGGKKEKSEPKGSDEAKPEAKKSSVFHDNDDLTHLQTESSDDKAPGNTADKDEEKPTKKAEAKDEVKGDKKADKKDEKTTKTAKVKKRKIPSSTVSVRSSSTGTSSESSISGSSTDSFTYAWDTSKEKDGNYLLRFSVTDKLSNPNDMQSIVNLRSVIVDNAAPEIAPINAKKLSDGKLELKVTAKDKLTPIANATFKIDDGEPFALSFEPSTLDGLEASLIATDVKVASGSHKIEVKVSDRAGNTTSKSITVK